MALETPPIAEIKAELMFSWLQKAVREAIISSPFSSLTKNLELVFKLCTLSIMTENVKILNKKGLNLAAILEFPDKNKKYPAVILLHGFTGYKNEEHIVSLADYLNENGYATIRFDASGFADSEGTVEKDYRMSNYLQDIKSVFEYLKTLDFVNPSRIGIWGHSMGAMLSVIFASQTSEIKAAVSCEAPVILMQAVTLKQEIKVAEEQGYFIEPSSLFGDIKIPQAFVDDSFKYNASESASKLTQPFLVISGLKDEDVEIGDGRTIFESAPEPKELAELEIHHDYKHFPDQIDQVNKKTEIFLRKYL